MEWLINTEWKGKTAKYLLLRDGAIESPLKECEHEGSCLWAANGGKVLINTPTLKVVRFSIIGLDKADRKKLENKDEEALKALTLQTDKPGKSGKKSQLTFSRVAVADDAENVIGVDLYKVLGIAEDEEQSKIKSKFRRLSVQSHPDKGGDPKVFNEIRDAYEVLGDPDQRKYYDSGGMQLVKNIELAWKEVDGQKAQLDAQLTKVPKNHPQYNQFKAQIEQQKKQFEPTHMRHEIEKKFRNEDLEVFVPISAAELYNGVSKKEYEFKRLVMCRGCRANPDGEECKDCGRCPPEKIQVPQYGMTPFGKQVVGMKEKEQESREKCREVGVKIKDLRVPRGAKEGSQLKYVSDVGHQTPGKLPGRIVLKVQRGSPEDTYSIAESDLHTVLHISLEQALFGFSHAFAHLGDEQVTVSHDQVSTTDEVIRFKKKGLVGDGGQRGDLYVRLAIALPKVGKGEKALTLKAGAASTPTLAREDPVELREGSAWRRWHRKAATGRKAKKDAKEEL
eukprot:CAMPEP_0198510232 /NCGR_PEP_ID=MMETSP1462-20131121/14056_1 /TAXON_ID=1333877 /ORGANISM="Brandtodinium nutriculum, Strain RCC3387" /LENGTH=506 /DNA_ID=CAMNT_0044239559 /DNA_START=45 /DNA_END=1565 /DNA_ORIENTATION=+